MGGCFYPWAGQEEHNQRLMAWLCRKYYYKFWDIINGEVDTVEAITEVNFRQLDRAQGWVGQDNLMENLVMASIAVRGSVSSFTLDQLQS